MKVLFCTNTFENGGNGPSKFARNILEINTIKFSKKVDIRILTEDISDHSPLIAMGLVFKANFNLNSITRPWGFLYRMFPYSSAARRVYKVFPFQIIVFNNAITGIWTALRLKVPVLGMINDYTSMSTGIGNFKWQYQWFRRIVFKQFERIATKVEQGIIVNSNYMLGLTRICYGVKDAKLRLLKKGIIIDRSIPPELPIIQSPIKILFVKSDFQRGGLFDVISALSKLSRYQFVLTIIGPAEEFRDMIMNKITSHHMAVNVLGHTSEELVHNYLKSSDLFVVPPHSEALGVANMEALLNGITVISSNVGGIPEVLDNGRNGWMVDPGNIDQLADAIEEAILNPEKREAKMKAGYAYVHKHFDNRACLQKIVDIVASFL